MNFHVKTAIFSGLLLYATTAPLACVEYDVMALPNFKGTITMAQGINDDDVVVGSYFNPDVGNVHAFRYDLNQHMLVDLGTLHHETESRALGINDHGMIMGTSGNQTFVYANDSSGLQSIGFSKPIPARDTKSALTPTACFGTAINHNGEVCGSQTFKEGGERPMFYNKTTGVIDLGLPEDTIGNGAALGLNSANEVVGVTYDSKNVGRATVWKLVRGKDNKKRVQSLYLLDGFPKNTGETIANGINDNHQVIGSFNDASGKTLAFLWTKETGPINLETLPGDTSAVAQAINNEGVVVGISSNTSTGEQRVFAWTQATGMIHLGATSTTTDLAVTSINDAGDVTVIVDTTISLLVKTNNLM